jgi:hypothetical protein
LKRRAPRCIGFAHESQTTYYVLRPLVFSGLRSIRIVPVTAGPDPANERLPPPDLIVIWLPDERLPNVAMFKGVQYSLATVIPVAPGRQITVVVPAYPIVIMEPSNAPGSPAAPPPVPGPR